MDLKSQLDLRGWAVVDDLETFMVTTFMGHLFEHFTIMDKMEACYHNYIFHERDVSPTLVVR